MSLPDQETFSLFLPSHHANLGGKIVNKPWSFEVVLAQPLNFKDHQEWSVAAAMLMVPPLKKTSTSKMVFVYVNVVQGTWVGNAVTTLLCTVDLQADPQDRFGGSVREPEHLLFQPVQKAYIERIWIELRDERGQYLDVDDDGATQVTLKFQRLRKPMGERTLVLPSNASSQVYPQNTPSSYTVVLPGPLNYNPNEWEVGLTHLSFPKPPVASRVLEGERTVGLGRWGIVRHPGKKPTLKSDACTVVWKVQLPQDRVYDTAEALCRDVNDALDQCLLHFHPHVQQGSYVDPENNQIHFDKVQHLSSSRETKILTSFTRTIPSGWYTFQELVQAINAQCPQRFGHPEDARRPLLQLSMTENYDVNDVSDTTAMVRTRSLETFPSDTLPSQFTYYRFRVARSGDVLARFQLAECEKHLSGYDFSYNYVDGYYERDLPAPGKKNAIPLNNFVKIRVRWDAPQQRIHLDLHEGINRYPDGIERYTPLWSKDLFQHLGLESYAKTTGVTMIEGPVVPALSKAPPVLQAFPVDWTQWKTEYDTSTFHVWTHRSAVGEARHWYTVAVMDSGVYVYSNLVQYSMVGDTSVPLMAVVPVVGGVHAERQSYEFKNPLYMPLRLAEFGEVHLDLRDYKGHPIFERGLVVARLHIRPREPGSP
jgi:hypothetical protein